MLTNIFNKFARKNTIKNLQKKSSLFLLGLTCLLGAYFLSSCMIRHDWATVDVLLPNESFGSRSISNGEKSSAIYKFWFNGTENDVGQKRVSVGMSVDIRVAAYDSLTGEQIATGTARIEKVLPGTNEVVIYLYEDRETVHIEMVAVEGGSVNLNGATNSVQAFKIGKYEVTQSQWAKVMVSTTGYADSVEDEHGRGSEYPMYYVAWYDAIAFCNKLSIRNGLSPCYSLDGETNPDKWPALNIQKDDRDSTWDGVQLNSDSNGYRLPTEQEWVFAATANGNYQYSGSDNIDEVAWYLNNSYGKSHPVGQKKPNGFGIYDMTGNVFEWCHDTASDGKRVAHGGNFDDAANSCTITNLGNNEPGFRGWNFGFRVVCGN